MVKKGKNGGYYHTTKKKRKQTDFNQNVFRQKLNIGWKM